MRKWIRILEHEGDDKMVEGARKYCGCYSFTFIHMGMSGGYLLLSTLLAGLRWVDLAVGELTLCAAPRARARARAITAGLSSLLASLMWVNLALGKFCACVLVKLWKDVNVQGRLTSGADTLVWLAILAETVVLGWLVVRHTEELLLLVVVWKVVKCLCCGCIGPMRS
jgi:hypothetical protein